MALANQIKADLPVKKNFIDRMKDGINKIVAEQEFEQKKLEVLFSALGKFASGEHQINARKIRSLEKFAKDTWKIDESKLDKLFEHFDEGIQGKADLIKYTEKYQNLVRNNHEQKKMYIDFLMFIAYWDRKIDEIEEVTIRSIIELLGLPENYYDSALFNVRLLKKIAALDVVEYGSGYFLSSDGYVITNYHVINNYEKISVRSNNRLFDAKIISLNKVADLCLLKVSGDFVPVRIEQKIATISQDILAFGYPKPKEQGYFLKITKGIICANHGLHDDCRMMQFDAPVQSGNSGGPIFDPQTGCLLGTIQSELKDGQYVSYAIKNSELLNFLSDIRCIKSKLCFEKFDAHEDIIENNKLSVCQIFVCR